MEKVARKERTSKGERCELQPVLPGLAELRGTLHDLVVGCGLRALSVLLEQERTAVCGPRYTHNPERRAVRAGHADGELSLGGRRVAVKRPRARTTAGEEVVLPSWERFQAQDPLTPRAVEQVLVGVATRKYARSLEPAPPGVSTRGTSKSAVSRRFVAATSAQVEDLLARNLNELDLAALMIDGIHVDEHVVLVALGIDVTGAKHVLGLWEGATENTVACTALLSNLRDRGLRTERSILVVIDGSKALAKAVSDVFGARALVQRCQVHKRRNVEEHLPEERREQVGSVISGAYSRSSAEHAKKILTGLARQLEREHPSAAASLREGLDETLTVTRLKLDPSLERTLRTTNPIENLNGLIRRTTRNVKRWQGGAMVLRWLAAALDEAAKGFRRLKGHAGMPKLVAQLRARDAELNSGVDITRKAA